MNLPTILTVFAGGTLLLLISTNYFVSSAISLSQSLRLSPLIIGTTFVAIGTSLPELSISLAAATSGDVGLAMGNVIGSNIVNILFVFPASILAGKLRVGTTKTPKTALFLLGTTVIFSLLYPLGLTPMLGLISLMTALAFSLLEYAWGTFGSTHEDRHSFSHHHRHHPQATITAVLSCLGIFIGSFVVVSSAESLSAATGISSTILGLSLVAIATSLPELLVSIISQSRHQEKMAAGNIIGSNIYNLLLIGGLIAFFSPVPSVSPINLAVLVAATGLFVWLIHYFQGRTLPRWLAPALLSLFLLYLWLQTR